MSLGIDVDWYHLLYFGADVVPEAEGFREWFDAHERLIGDECFRLTPLDESLTLWTVSEMLIDADDRPVLLDDEIAIVDRIITTTPGRPHWLIECDLTTCDDVQ